MKRENVLDYDNENDIHDNVDNNYNEFSVMIAMIIVEITLLHTSCGNKAQLLINTNGV